MPAIKKSDRWDSEVWGIPLNQFDLAMTNLAFSSVVLLGIRAIGIWPTKQEAKSFLHFWRYVGWLMGIDENGLFSLNLRVGGYFTGCSLLILAPITAVLN